MDEHVKWTLDMRVQRTIENLKKNGFETHYFETAVDYLTYLDAYLPKGCTVSVGGSRTVFETGTIELLQSGKYNYLDRYAPNLNAEEIKAIYRQCFSADYYIMSSNAVTESGHLYNVDGTGNRVAALSYGPEHVIVVVGENKLVKDDDAAIQRNQEISAPANSKRLSRKTPCAVTGICSDCNSPDRVCHSYVFTRRNTMNRVCVMIIGESHGY